jgi:hypothetical protein
MGVYIEGLDMPKEGEHIIALIKNDGKVFYFEQDIETTTCKIMKDTEAIQIPTPHGRLIDANKIFTYSHWEEQAVSEAPTILEAEE